MDTQIAVQRISELALLDSLPEETRRQVAEVFLNVSDLIHYDQGDPLITAGYLSFDTGYLLLDGKAAIEKAEQNGIQVAAPALLGEMAQFSSVDIRSATVRAEDAVTAAQFYWEDLYHAAERELSEEAYLSFRHAVELQLWERFEFKHITQLALFAGLDEALKQKVCLPFPTIGERVRLKEVDTLFNEGAKSQGTGYMLVAGTLRLYRKESGEKILQAPELVGIFPGKAERAATWSATAMANGEAEVLRFSWEKYMGQLVKRLDRAEQQAFATSVQQNAAKHFRH